MSDTTPREVVRPALEVALPAQPGPLRPVTQGVPFLSGECREIGAFAVRSPSGEKLPAHGRPLFHWPDGSVRWALVSFLARQGGAHELLLEEVAPAIDHPVSLHAGDQTCILSNGLAEITLAASGPGPIHRLSALGHRWLTSPQALRLIVNDADSTHEPPRTLRVMESSPLRARVRVEGAHHRADGSRHLNYRLDVELWAGLPTVRLDYHFFNLEPGADALDIEQIALDFRFALPAEATRRHVQQQTWGLYTTPRAVLNPAPVALVTDDRHARPCAEEPGMLLDETQYPFYLRPPRVDTAEWLGITTEAGPAVYAAMHEFAAMRPKRLASAGNGLTLEVWPRRAGVLSLPQGRSRRQSLTLAFAEAGPLPGGEVAQRIGELLHEGRACVSRAWLVRCQVFDQHRMLTPHQAPRFEKFFHRLMKLEMPQAMFDLGDTNETGYQSSYNGENYVLPVVENPPPRVFKTDTFLHPLSDPGAYEPVWSNNEYDGIYAFCSEWLRTGRPELWPVIQRLARHNIEVDFLHYSDHRWLHRATPAHSARHTSTGAYPSHFWTQGLLLYHCLTGDPEALEVATALGEKILENFADPEVRPVLWGFNRELGWPVLALSHLVDLTGDSRQRAQLEELVDFLVSFDRGTFGGAIKLSAGNALHGMNRQIIDNFFGYASMVEGVEHYLSHTPRSPVQQWFEALLQDLTHELAEAHRQGAALSPTHMHALGMAIALDRAGDGRAIDSGMLSLQELIDGPEWASPKPEVKNVTMIHRGFVRFLEHARRQGALAELDYRRGF